MGRILGIDYGLSRVGLAISDPLKITAQGLNTLEISGNNDLFFEKVENLAKQYSIEKIVIGYPKHLNGDLSNTSELVDGIVQKLNALGFDVIKWDERLTTVMAHKTMRDLGITQKDKKRHADRLAAIYILEDYLQYIS